jgi:hypothetical protein
LQQLQTTELRIIFSSDLVPPTLRVASHFHTRGFRLQAEAPSERLIFRLKPEATQVRENTTASQRQPNCLWGLGAQDVVFEPKGVTSWAVADLATSTSAPDAE